MTQQIQTIEDFLANESNNKKDFIKEQTKSSIKRTRKKQDSQLLNDVDSKEQSKVILAKDAITALKRAAKETLKNYVSMSPQYKTILQQIGVLKEQALEYKRAGDSENFDFCKEQIVSLNQTKKKFDNLTKPRTTETTNETNKKIKDSDKLKELKNKATELNKEYRITNPNSLKSSMSKFREILKISGNYFDEENNSIEDLSDFLNSSESELKIEYRKLCERIVELSNYVLELDDVMYTMNINSIFKILDEYMPEEYKERLNELNDEINQNKIETSIEIKKLKGYNDVTDIMMTIFDFEVQEEEPKEMLASANISLVESIAYNQCSRKNKMQYYQDAIAYGLLGLTKAINKWYSLQKLSDSALSFDLFAYKYISGDIKKGLFELSGGGMISGSRAATMDHFANKNKELFLKNNKELADLPQDILDDLLDDMFSTPKTNIMSESEYSDMVTGGESDADVWANAAASMNREDNIMDSKFEYESLVSSLKSLFDLFETKVNKETGIKQITDKKMFNKYDYKLFLMSFGLMTKYNPETGKDEPYDQNAIAEEMVKMYAADGIKNKTFSQPAIAARKKKILEQINIAMENNPSMKKGFEYLMYYFMSNRDNINLISNSKEDLGISYDKDFSDNTIRKEKYGIPNTLASNVKSIDNQIAEDFRNYIN